MRYLLITYFQRANGKYDESVDVAARLKNKQRQLATVILDFRDKRVEKVRAAELGEAARDFTKLRNFYAQHHPDVIKHLEAANAVA